MPSPFPGMDPYLEGYLWPDLQHRLATHIANLLTAQIAPRYVARIGVRTVLEVVDTGEEIGVMLPDVEVSAAQGARGRRHTQPAALLEPITPETATLVQPLMVEAEIPSVEIRDYDLSLDYTKPPEYPLPGEDGRWARKLLEHDNEADSSPSNGTASS